MAATDTAWEEHFCSLQGLKTWLSGLRRELSKDVWPHVVKVLLDLLLYTYPSAKEAAELLDEWGPHWRLLSEGEVMLFKRVLEMHRAYLKKDASLMEVMEKLLTGVSESMGNTVEAGAAAQQPLLQPVMELVVDCLLHSQHVLATTRVGLLQRWYQKGWLPGVDMAAVLQGLIIQAVLMEDFDPDSPTAAPCSALPKLSPWERPMLAADDASLEIEAAKDAPPTQAAATSPHSAAALKASSQAPTPSSTPASPNKPKAATDLTQPTLSKPSVTNPPPPSQPLSPNNVSVTDAASTGPTASAGTVSHKAPQPALWKQALKEFQKSKTEDRPASTSSKIKTWSSAAAAAYERPSSTPAHTQAASAMEIEADRSTTPPVATQPSATTAPRAPTPSITKAQVTPSNNASQSTGIDVPNPPHSTTSQAPHKTPQMGVAEAHPMPPTTATSPVSALESTQPAPASALFRAPSSAAASAPSSAPRSPSDPAPKMQPTSDKSHATVATADKSHATVATADKSHATVATADKSHATVATADKSHATVATADKSHAAVATADKSHATVITSGPPAPSATADALSSGGRHATGRPMPGGTSPTAVDTGGTTTGGAAKPAAAEVAEKQSEAQAAQPVGGGVGTSGPTMIDQTPVVGGRATSGPAGTGKPSVVGGEGGSGPNVIARPPVVSSGPTIIGGQTQTMDTPAPAAPASAPAPMRTTGPSDSVPASSHPASAATVAPTGQGTSQAGPIPTQGAGVQPSTQKPTTTTHPTPVDPATTAAGPSTNPTFCSAATPLTNTAGPSLGRGFSSQNTQSSSPTIVAPQAAATTAAAAAPNPPSSSTKPRFTLADTGLILLRQMLQLQHRFEEMEKKKLMDEQLGATKVRKRRRHPSGDEKQHKPSKLSREGSRSRSTVVPAALPTSKPRGVQAASLPTYNVTGVYTGLAGEAAKRALAAGMPPPAPGSTQNNNPQSATAQPNAVTDPAATVAAAATGGATHTVPAENAAAPKVAGGPTGSKAQTITAANATATATAAATAAATVAATVIGSSTRTASAGSADATAPTGATAAAGVGVISGSGGGASAAAGAAGVTVAAASKQSGKNGVEKNSELRKQVAHGGEGSSGVPAGSGKDGALETLMQVGREMQEDFEAAEMLTDLQDLPASDERSQQPETGAVRGGTDGDGKVGTDTQGEGEPAVAAAEEGTSGQVGTTAGRPLRKNLARRGKGRDGAPLGLQPDRIEVKKEKGEERVAGEASEQGVKGKLALDAEGNGTEPMSVEPAGLDGGRQEGAPDYQGSAWKKAARATDGSSDVDMTDAAGGGVRGGDKAHEKAGNNVSTSGGPDPLGDSNPGARLDLNSPPAATRAGAALVRACSTTHDSD